MSRLALLLLIGSVGTFVVGCSTTPQDLEAKGAATAVTKAYAENYQAVYRRISQTATRCRTANAGPYASFNVDAELYSDLGFGEVTSSLINWGVRNYYWKAKVEKTAAGSTVTVHSGNTLFNAKARDQILRWADGDTAC